MNQPAGSRSFIDRIQQRPESSETNLSKATNTVSLRLFVLMALLLSGPLLAQRNSGVHEDPSGEWIAPTDEDRGERFSAFSGGPELGDYLGVPLNDAGRYAADSFDISIVTLAENTCKGHSADHSWRQASAMVRIWKDVGQETQQVIAYRTHIDMMAPEETIYMDGRAHPPDYAPYTWQGFSTGKWEGDILAVTADHMKNNFLRWNGIPRSEKSTLSRHFMRHGNYLTIAVVIYDPVYLTEPWIGTLDFVNRPGEVDLNPYGCEAIDEVDYPRGTVPSRMPGTNTFVKEFPARWGIPPDAARGGAETMYPEYIAKMKTMKKVPRIENPLINGVGSAKGYPYPCGSGGGVTFSCPGTP